MLWDIREKKLQYQIYWPLSGILMDTSLITPCWTFIILSVLLSKFQNKMVECKMVAWRGSGFNIIRSKLRFMPDVVTYLVPCYK